MSRKKKYNRSRKRKSKNPSISGRASDANLRQLVTCIRAIVSNIVSFSGSLDDREHACQTISVQLRKLLLEREPLIERCYQKNVLKFHPLVQVPLAEKPFYSTKLETEEGGYISFTKVANADNMPTHRSDTAIVPIKRCLLSTEIYPLPGLSYDKYKKEFTIYSPFNRNDNRFLYFDEWLRQNMISIHGRNMTLQDIIKTIADEEGAHSRDPDKIHEQSNIFLARNYMFAGYSYFHWIILYTASYLIGIICDSKINKDALIRRGLDIKKIPQLREYSFSDKAISVRSSFNLLEFRFVDNGISYKSGVAQCFSIKPCQKETIL